MDTQINLSKHIPGVQESYSLQALNSLQAGGVADYFVMVEDTIELATAVKAAIDIGIPYMVIGEADKVLFSDGGFPGLVIQNKAHSLALALDKSQMVVDSGTPLATVLNVAASRGLGGLTSFYGQKGTVGGAMYANSSVRDQSFLSLVRYATLIVPPARIDTEAKIIRYKREWFEHASGKTKLQVLRETRGLEAQPIILTALLQLTSVRTDEIMGQMSHYSDAIQVKQPTGRVLGPLFFDEHETSLSELLYQSKAHKLRLGNVYLDKRFPFLMRSKTTTNRSSEIRQLIERVQEQVEAETTIRLRPRLEWAGVW